MTAAHTTTCPACEARLGISDMAARGETQIRCPRCGTQFTAMPAEAETAELLRPRALATPLLLAGGGSLVLIAAAVAGIFVIASRQQPPQVIVAHSNTDPAAQVKPAAPGETPEQRAENKDRQDRFIRLMVRAGLAKEKKQFAKSAAAYQEALTLQPGNPEAIAGLSAAEAGLKTIAVVAEDRSKRQAEFSRWMEQGKDALAAKQPNRAVQAFETALALVPGNAEATQALDTARKQLAHADGDIKQQGEYEDHMTAGRAAMVAQRYTDAVREFLAAQRVKPDDAAAARGVQDAEKRLGELKDDQKRKDAYVRMMRHGRAAVRSGHYAEAVGAFKAALKVVPDDREAKKALRDAKSGLQQAKTQYTQLMTNGTAALQLNNVPAALLAFQQALQLFPNDPTALAAIRQAQQLGTNLTVAQVALNNAQGGYNELMQLGTVALYAQRYADAAQAFTNALSLLPGDPQALQGLFEAQGGLAAAVQNGPSYADQMRRGADAYRHRRYADAIAAYQAALQLEPNDPQGLANLAQANYALHMSNGQTAMQTRRYRDAAAEFRAALLQAPGDALALTGLRQASLLAR